MAATKLTGKQEKFAQLVAQGKDQSEAYRSAYNAENMVDNSIHVNASKLAADAKVSLRIEYLKEQAAKRNEVTLDECVGYVRQAIQLALADDDKTNLRGGSMDLAKLAGLLVDKKDIKGQMSIKALLEELDE